MLEFTSKRSGDVIHQNVTSQMTYGFPKYRQIDKVTLRYGHLKRQDLKVNCLCNIIKLTDFAPDIMRMTIKLNSRITVEQQKMYTT